MILKLIFILIDWLIDWVKLWPEIVTDNLTGNTSDLYMKLYCILENRFSFRPSSHVVITVSSHRNIQGGLESGFIESVTD